MNYEKPMNPRVIHIDGCNHCPCYCDEYDYHHSVCGFESMEEYGCPLEKENILLVLRKDNDNE